MAQGATFPEIDAAVLEEEWIWFDNNTMYGSETCINSRDALAHIGPTIKTLLDHAVVEGNKYTLTNKFVVVEDRIDSWTQVQTPWTKAYSEMSHFAEWGLQGMPNKSYRHIRTLLLRHNTLPQKLQELVVAGIKFSHIIVVEEETEQNRRL